MKYDLITIFKKRKLKSEYGFCERNRIRGTFKVFSTLIYTFENIFTKPFFHKDTGLYFLKTEIHFVTCKIINHTKRILHVQVFRWFNFY